MKVPPSGQQPTHSSSTPAPGPDTPSVAISVEHATKVFPRTNSVVFNDLNMVVNRNEAFSIVGPSGCGKTTLLRCIDGLTELTSGVIRVDGDPVVGPTTKTVMVFQHFGLLPWQTVEKNVAFGLRMAGVKKPEWGPRVADAIETVGLRGVEKSYPTELSGGMRQRVGLARALAMDSDVFLMDEPFASVDAQTRQVLQDQLLDIWNRAPRTMVFITHSIEEALVVGDRVAVLSPRPARVKEVLDVPFGRPRSMRDVLASPVLGELREHVWDLLQFPTRSQT
jgi:NitT/TauT family transport system ATP-binding protein